MAFEIVIGLTLAAILFIAGFGLLSSHKQKPAAHFVISTIDYQPGQTVVLKTKVPLSQQQMRTVTQEIQSVLGRGTPVLILDPEFDIAVFRTTTAERK
jgi:hypothetical protein